MNLRESMKDENSQPTLPVLVVVPDLFPNEESGHPVEFRFRNRVVGAEADLGMGDGVAGVIAVLTGSCELVNGGAFRLFDGGLVSVVCGLYPNARPIAATPMVPVAHSWP
ncbi:MAG: hypothetical protein Q9216_003392 [Gyalolechia sp. 2 TL-2023]